MTEPPPIFTPDHQSSFNHATLTSFTTSIRLLSLAPGYGDAPLSGTLHQHSLDSDLEYEALSYMWGPTEPKQPLQLDGQIFQLRPNIQAFLTRLRDPTESRTIWLDAVCIDQNNITERSAQVSLMRKIYQSCRHCLVWLGQDVPRADEVIQLFAANPADEVGMTDLNNLIRLIYSNGLTDAFRELLSHPYWTRIWMLQETTLAEKVIVHGGSSTCLLDNLPTQVRGLMFEVFQSSRARYQEWLKLFNDFDNPCHLRDIDISELNARNNSGLAQVYPGLVGPKLRKGQQSTMMLGFQRSNDQPRWDPWAVEVERVDHEDKVHAIFRAPVTLSTVSELSFSIHHFDPCSAFKSMECAFWCTGNSKSEQLLAERRRYSDSAANKASSLDFRNYLEHADRWYCTDIRDRVFGALGVFTVWPQERAFQADYSLAPHELLVHLVDYCRPTDPFKLGIRLLSALEIDAPTAAFMSNSRRPETLHNHLRLMSRIAWPLHNFDLQQSIDSPTPRFIVTGLPRSDVPRQAQSFLYFISPNTHPKGTDTIASMGDAAVVIGIRDVSPLQDGSQWSCVGIGFDFAPNSDPLHNDHLALDVFSPAHVPATGFTERASQAQSVNYQPMLEIVQNLRHIRIAKAEVEDKSEDGRAVLWWIHCPKPWFWWLLAREERLRIDKDSENDSVAASSEDAFGSIGAFNSDGPGCVESDASIHDSGLSRSEDDFVAVAHYPEPFQSGSAQS